MTLALVQEIGELKALGFSRWEALLLVALVSLFAYLRAQIARDRKAFAKAEKQRDEERTERDKDRAHREAKIEKRLTESEDKHTRSAIPIGKSSARDSTSSSWSSPA